MTEIPLALLLAVTIHYGPMTEGVFKLVPLMVALISVMLFILIFFFRMVVVSYEEVRYRGPFSSRDRAFINKDKTLIITMYPHGNLDIDLYGNDGKPPMFAGLKDEPPMDIYLFRGKTIGSRRTVRSLLTYFGIPTDDAAQSLKVDEFSREYELVSFTAKKKEDIRELRIKFKETV
jgi:hypothetical protein